MTQPPDSSAGGEESGRADGRDRIPSQAELDAEDLAELRRTSADRDAANLYPKPVEDPGPAPRALTVHARYLFFGAALSGVICVLYGVLTNGAVTERLQDRLLTGAIEEPGAALSTDGIASFAQWAPWFMYAVTLLLLAGEYVLLTAAVKYHSRSLRNLFLTLVLVNLLSIPIGLDLLFRYPDVPSGVLVLGWLQCGLLALAAVVSLRRPVEKWLPPSTRMRPTRMFRS